MSISNIVKSIQNIMLSDQGVDGDAQRISQLSWMLFLKILDDSEWNYELDESYISPIPEDLRWRNWAADDEGITGEELLNFVNNRLFPTLKDPEVMLTASNGRGRMIYNIFMDAFNYMKNGTLMRQIINRINEIDFASLQDRHVFNDIYEKILKDLQSAGNSGEFYTPRPVTQFMTDMLNPRLGEVVLDPACGTGGFLVCALENIRKQDVHTPQDRLVLQKSIQGIEKKSLPHMLCVTNLILHDVDIPDILHDNALGRRPLSDYSAADQVDVVLTNPPFGGNEEPGVENNFPQKFRTKETADMFIALILKLLKEEGGRAAVILPDGFLFGEGVKTRLKEHLLQTCNLHTIVRLPNSVFAPYTSISTNLLFFEKGSPTQEIWYFEHPMPAGQKHYSKTRPIRLKEFELEKQWWQQRLENEHAWRVSIEDLRKNGYNLDIKNPNNGEEDLADPQLLLQRYEKQQLEIEDLRRELKNILTGALEK